MHRDRQDRTQASRRDFVRTLAMSGTALCLPPSILAARAGDQMAELSAGNPKLYAIMQDIVRHANYVIAAAAAGQPAAGNPLAAATQTFLATRRPANAARFRAAAVTQVNAPPAVRQSFFGRYGTLTPAEIVTLPRAALRTRIADLGLRGTIAAAEIAAVREPGQSDPSPDPVTEDSAESSIVVPPNSSGNADQNAALGREYKYLECFIKRVDCLEGTGDPGDHDEIALGGYAIGANGNRHKVKQWLVSENFTPNGRVNTTQTDIRARDYSDINGRHFAFYSIFQNPPWPHDYQATLAMGELDHGGFTDFLGSLWDSLAFELAQALGELAVEGVTALVGTAIPIPGLGTILGAIIGSIIGAIVKAWKDDVVGVAHTVMTLNGGTYSVYHVDYPTEAHPHWHGHLASKHGVRYTREYADTGHYRVELGWRVMKQITYDQRRTELDRQRQEYQDAIDAAS